MDVSAVGLAGCISACIAGQAGQQDFGALLQDRHEEAG